MANPKQMNANYRKNERLLEKNPTPIDIGLSEDVKEYVDSQITEELPEYTTSDEGKVLGVTVDSSGEEPVAELEWVEIEKSSGYVFVRSGSIVGGTKQPGEVYNALIMLDGVDYTTSDTDFLIICKPSTGVLIDNVNDTNKTSITVQCKNLGTSATSTYGSYYLYKKPKSSTNNHISVIGGISLSSRIMELPTTLGTAGQVLAVNSGANGVEWANPAGMTEHSYTTLGELFTDLMNHSTAIMKAPGNVYFSFSFVSVDGALNCQVEYSKNEYDSTNSTIHVYGGTELVPLTSTDTSLLFHLYGVKIATTSPFTITNTNKTLSFSASNIKLYY